MHKSKVFIFFIACLLSACTTQHPSLPEQNAFAYLPKNTLTKPLVSIDQQKQITQDYLNHYFSPWTGKQLTNTPEELQAYERGVIVKYLQSPGVGSNQLAHSEMWVEKIASNMNLETPNTSINAITTTSTDERVLPSLEPVFLQWSNLDTTNAYPFDRLQNSLLTTNTPVKIIRTSVDGAWQLVIAPSSSGWIRSRDLAVVDKNFIRSWHTKNYAVITRDGVAVKDAQGLFRLHGHIGAIFPLVQVQSNRLQILIAVPTQDRHAVLKKVWINRDSAAVWPLPFTQKNIGDLANAMLGKPYGWGGMYGFRDCSASMQDLFASVGLWLPRNSSEQANTGAPVDFKGLSVAEQKDLLRTQGVPGLTLLRQPGHILLYIGEQDHAPYVYQSIWGSSGDHFYGRTVITPYTQAIRMTTLVSTQ